MAISTAILHVRSWKFDVLSAELKLILIQYFVELAAVLDVLSNIKKWPQIDKVRLIFLLKFLKQLFYQYLKYCEIYRVGAGIQNIKIR